MTVQLMEDDDTYCPIDGKRMAVDLDGRVYRCDHCTTTRPFGEFRAPLVTAESARSLVGLYLELLASGEPMPVRRVRVASSEAAA